MKHINIGSQPNDNTGDSVRESFNKTNQNFQEIQDMILDEDDFASDSESSLATQQSIKAYVDAEVATAGKVDSVNGEQGAVVLDSGKITEGSNLYYTEDRVSNNTNVVANTAKISADGSVTEHNDVTDAGSGKIITDVERLTINDNSQAINNLALNNHPKATLSADSDPALTLSGQEFKLTLPQLLNEDDLGSESEIEGATQKSIKTYVDNHSLRGVPVNTVADLQALDAKEYELRQVKENGREYVFEPGVSGTGENLDANNGTGAWIYKRPATFIATIDSVTDLDNSEFKDGDILRLAFTADGNSASNELLTISEEEKPGSYEFSNAQGATLYANRTTNALEYFEIEDGELEINVAYSGIQNFDRDLDFTTATSRIRRKPGHTDAVNIRDANGIVFTIPADDYEWHDFKRLNYDRVEYSGTPYTKEIETLRGTPVIDLATLTALNAKDYEIRRVGATTEYKFVLGKTPEGTDVADDAGTGAWELLPNLQTMESDVLLGQTFFSTSKRIRPGLCYAGETYNWSDNSKLKSLFDAEGHDFITDNGDNTFTVVDHTDFIRPGATEIGQYQQDTVRSHTHTYQSKPANFGEVNDGSNYFRGDSGRNGSLITKNTGAFGDGETAPRHRKAYFGIYGDLAVTVANADLVPVEDVENIIYEVANYNGPGLKINTSGHSEISLGFDITACDYIDFTFGDTNKASIQDQYIWHDSVDVATLQASQKWIARRHDNNYIWFRTNAGQDLTLGELEARGYNIPSNTHVLKAVGYAKKTLKSIINPSVNILDEDDMASNSRTEVPSQQSVKTYVDNRPTLRGLPVSDLASLTSIDAKDFEIRRVDGVGTFEFKLGGTPDANNPADDAGTGAWFRTVAQESISRLNYHDTIQYYFDNNWDNTKADFGTLEGFTKDTNNHYQAERDMLLDMTATLQISEGSGLTVGLAWQIYTGTYWQTIGTDGTEQSTPMAGQNRYTDHTRIRINQGEYIRLLGRVTDGGSNSYPGNRNIRVSIVEINQSQFQTSLTTQEPELVNEYLPANVNRNTETRITVLQAVLPTPGIWSINTKMTVFDVQDVVPGFEVLVEDNSVILEDAIEVGENNAIYNRFSKSGSITVKTTTNNAIVKLDGLWTNNSDTQYVESDNSYTFINAVQLYKN